MHLLWLAPLPVPRSSWPGVPALHAGMVLVGVPGGMAAFDAATGDPRWNALIWSTGEGSFSGNIAAHGHVACNADYFGVGCADIVTGEVRWTRHEDQPTQDGQSAIDATTLYYGTVNHSEVARDLATGEPRWVTDVDPGNTNLSAVFGVAVRGDTVFAATGRWLTPTGGRQKAGDLIALSRTTGEELWRYTGPTPSGFQGAPQLAGNLAILNDVYMHGLVAVDLTSRQQAWHTPVGPDGYVNAERPPVLVGDTLFSGSTDTQVHAVDVCSGAIRWRVRTWAGSIGNTAVCGRAVLVVPMAGGPLNIVDRVQLRPYGTRLFQGDELRGGIAVSGTTAYATGWRGLYAIAFPE